ncbi:MAG TPA: hypothetical protein VK034_18410, partial [Enhygromyxa sp.]|nr:hypothetical protein [Enhygromyxa sp.]
MATTKPKSKQKQSGKTARKKNDGAPGWVAPAAVGGGLLILGIGLVSRRASAKGEAPAKDNGSSDPKSDPSSDPNSNNNNNGDRGADGTQPSDRPTNDGDITFPVYSGQEGANKLEEVCKAAGLDNDWTRFFLATARGESAFTSNVVLGDPTHPTGSKPSPETDKLGVGEASGARTAYNRGVSEGRYSGCPWPASAYTWGSGGWLQMLPANAWHAYT